MEARKTWRKRAVPAVYVGTYADPAGATACVFADPRSGRALGPLNLALPGRGRKSFPAPRVGAPPAARAGRLGLLEYYAADGEPRGVFLRFEEGSETRDPAQADPFLLGLRGEVARDAPEAALYGLVLGGHGDAATALAARLGPKAVALAALVFRGVPPPLPLPPGYALFAPGYLAPGDVEGPDAGPFWDGSLDPFRFLRAAGEETWRAALATLEGARDVDAAWALGFDARGRLLALAEGRVERLLWCSPQAPPRFGDDLRLRLQDDRVGWAASRGNAAAEAVQRLRGPDAAPLLARAAELGLRGWDAWTGPGPRIDEALATHPTPEHARRVEPFLPGPGTSPERLRAVLATVAVYWRAGAFEDAWILLGRMPKLLPETKDAPVLRASRLLHRLLEGGHVHDATDEARDELTYVWDGALSAVAEELGIAGRCLEVLENAGL